MLRPPSSRTAGISRPQASSWTQRSARRTRTPHRKRSTRRAGLAKSHSVGGVDRPWRPTFKGSDEGWGGRGWRYRCLGARERRLRVLPRTSLTTSVAVRHWHLSAALTRHPGECIYGWRVGTSVAVWPLTRLSAAPGACRNTQSPAPNAVSTASQAARQGSFWLSYAVFGDLRRPQMT